jgi:DNA-binding NtrC family response regulator
LGGLDVITTSRSKNQDLWERLASQTFDLIVLGDDDVPSPMEEGIGALRALPGAPEVIVVSGDYDPTRRGRLLAAGCEAVLSADMPEEMLRDAFATMIRRQHQTVQLRLQAKDQNEYRLGDFVSFSPSMRQLLYVAQRVAEADTTVLILGETGSGKEWLARAIHSEGSRASGPFVAVNCGAIPEGLIESHFFGHRNGAFTGATSDHRGHFEVAHGGTIFLDEIVEMPTHLQVRLLRVLQERKFQRVGSERSIDVDVRVIAATNRHPAQEIKAGRMREDLYYRIGVVTLTLPPLRDRVEDIPSLAENHFEIFCSRLGRALNRIDRDAMSALVAYHWPGNVRELINVMERAVLLATGTSVTIADLPVEIGRQAPTRGAAQMDPGAVFPGGGKPEPVINKKLSDARRILIDDFEKKYLTALLEAYGGRVGEAARQAGITPRALFNKLKRHGLRKEDFKADHRA